MNKHLTYNAIHSVHVDYLPNEVFHIEVIKMVLLLTHLLASKKY